MSGIAMLFCTQSVSGPLQIFLLPMRSKLMRFKFLLTEALDSLKRQVIEEIVIKHPDGPEAERVFNDQDTRLRNPFRPRGCMARPGN
jgi:hypothetical protein